MLTIQVTSGVGEGGTTLSAFDAALAAAGIANFNLIPLSSVIPTGATVVEKRPDFNDDCWGHRLYVVLAELRTEHVGQDVWAGIGWIQEPDTGRGLFVEHYGTSEASVSDQVWRSLESMRAYRTQSFGDIEMVTIGTRCEGRPVSALVAAVFRSSGW